MLSTFHVDGPGKGSWKDRDEFDMSLQEWQMCGSSRPTRLSTSRVDITDLSAIPSH